MNTSTDIMLNTIKDLGFPNLISGLFRMLQIEIKLTSCCETAVAL